jgi:FAD/FMN-containing dehydrogenase
MRVSSPPITTYEGIWKFEPHRLVSSASIDDICKAVADATSAGLRVRAMGFGNSWPAHVVTRDVLVNIRKLNRIHAIDPVGKTVSWMLAFGWAI